MVPFHRMLLVIFQKCLLSEYAFPPGAICKIANHFFSCFIFIGSASFGQKEFGRKTFDQLNVWPTTSWPVSLDQKLSDKSVLMADVSTKCLSVK
jgi:hypothetical protein